MSAADDLPEPLAASPAPFDLEAVRARLASERGPRLWKSLEELGASEGFREWLAREHPAQVRPFMDPPSRRDALKFVAASLALAGASSCTRQPREAIVSWARNPESSVPGKPLFFATAMPWSSGSLGLLVESHLNRPTKIEGNPEHPASLGATDVFSQAAVLSLYDPDRTQVVQRRGRIATWNAFLTELERALAAQGPRGGAGLRVLTPTVTSPTLGRQLRALRERFPECRWHQWEAVNRDGERAAALRAFGEDARAWMRWGEADVIVSLDADFLGEGPGAVRATREIAARRREAARGGRPLRLYAFEPTPTLTGAAADHRFARRPDEIELFAHELMAAMHGESEELSPLAHSLSAELRSKQERALIVAGRGLSPGTQALVHELNRRLAAFGSTQVWTRPLEEEPVDQAQSVRELVLAMRAGRVELLVILGGNPVYDAPADLGFAEALGRVPFRVHLAHTEDETSALCDWHVPRCHFLESWSDTRAEDGTASIVQPLIAPLHQSRSEHELLSALLGEPQIGAYEAVRTTWRAHFERTQPGEDFERSWSRALHAGLVPQTSFEPLEPGRASIELERQPERPASAAGALTLCLRPDPTVWDGRFANNGWLQELPKPLTKLTWDNAALLSPATAQRLGVASHDLLELALGGRKLRVPAWILPGQADECVTLHLGYGRTRAGSLGDGRGANAYLLRTSLAPHGAPGLALARTGERRRLASTQEHDSMEGRDLVRTATLERFLADAGVFERHAAHGGHETSMYPPVAYEGHAWGMVIDLNACTGCSACVVACQAENNIPVVGPEEVLRGREMHWIRVDRYFEGDPAAPAVHHQPVPCMHCENAPCEVVCPVNATVHSAEGLNDMVYNRCVGTRYCANNCPYKVRRFNFFAYSDFETETLKLQRNPDVTVRSRGVMEKCTYCVQRINQARIEAKKQGRPIRDGEVRTACQQVCPAEAIVFGDLNDPGSKVARLRSNPRVYGLLEELNTKPRTTYGGKLSHPEPRLGGRG